MTYNAAERKDVRAAEKAAAFAETQRGEVIKGIMSTGPGRAWLCDRLVAAHLFTVNFPIDALAMAFSEGERNQGMQLLNDLMLHCPDLYILMMRERNERDAARDSASRQRSRSPNGDGGDQGPTIDDVYDDPGPELYRGDDREGLTRN